MASKLDQSLEEIHTAQRKASGRRRNPPRAQRPATAPVGGIHKSVKPVRGAGTKATPAAKGAAASGDSKIIVSGLPKDVSEQQIKEYFNQSVGSIKRVDVVYGQNSQSRGIANITFGKADGASKAFQKLNGLLVDNRPIKIEIVVGAAQADKVIPAVKSLADRAAQPKPQPKSATATKKGVAAKGAASKTAPAKAGDKKRRGRNARPAKKTADELDSEMADYFTTSNEGAATAPATAPAAPAAGGDAAMQDEIM